MFKRDASQGNHAETIIAVGVRVEGDFISKGNVIIDGEVTGTLHTDEGLHVGESARIQANVSAKTAVIAGEVQGNVQVEDRLDILETSRIHGDIHARVFSVAAGAVVNGRINMDAASGSSRRKGAPVETSEGEE